MFDRNYYCISDDGCEFPTMTYEQILAAIAEATGSTPTKINDAFISKVKELNKNEYLAFWVGTTAQYNAIEVKDEKTLYILTDDDTAGDIDQRLEDQDKKISENTASINELKERTETLKISNYITDDYTNVSYMYNGVMIHANVSAGLYMIRVKNDSVGTNTNCSFMFDFTGSKDMYSCSFKYDNGTEVKEAVLKAEAKGAGEFWLKVVPSPTDSTEDKNFTVSVRKIGSGYAVG